MALPGSQTKVSYAREGRVVLVHLVVFGLFPVPHSHSYTIAGGGRNHLGLQVAAYGTIITLSPGPMSLSSASPGPLIPILADVKETQENPTGNPHLA